MLAPEIFKVVVENTPLIAIDLIIRNEKNKILLGKRLNKPAQNFWFVPGGRIFKDETLDSAFARIVKNETNLDIARSSANFIDIFEHFYEDSHVAENISTHYVMLVYEICVKLEDGFILPTKQHNEYVWLSEADLHENNQVHNNTKIYFS